MNLKAIFSIFLVCSLSGCGILSSSGPSSEYASNAVVGTVAGAAIGTAIGAAIEDGDIANSAMLGAGVGLAVGVVGTYAYKKIKIHNQIVGNDEAIEANRNEILAKQSELDSMRAAAIDDSRDIEFDKSRPQRVYEGPTLGLYYR